MKLYKIDNRRSNNKHLRMDIVPAVSFQIFYKNQILLFDIDDAFD